LWQPVAVIYVALLRGINVGGRARVPMAALRDTCTGAGCDDVVTYIQSGNVVLRSRLGAERLRTVLETAIAERFGFRPAVMIRTGGELAAVVAGNPFAGVDAAHVHVGFLPAPPDGAAEQCLAAIDCAPEAVAVAGRDLYLYLPNGMGRAELPVRVGRCLRPVELTVRNWRTITKLAELAAG
jgi:uncharacterized protein (DUF1697 family)